MSYTENDLLTLYNDPNFYDLEFSERKEDVEFFKVHCEKNRGLILELACGTGRITNEIAKLGLNIKGKDISKSMINKAISNYPRIDFEVEDMIKTTGSYNLIFCATNAFQHVLDEEKALFCLKSIKKSLKQNGKFILDIQNPIQEKLLRDFNQPYKYKTFNYKGDHVEAFITASYNSLESIYYFRINYKIGEKTIKYKSVAMKMYTHLRIQELISASGLIIDQCYGDYSQNLFDSNSTKQIF